VRLSDERDEAGKHLAVMRVPETRPATSLTSSEDGVAPGPPPKRNGVPMLSGLILRTKVTGVCGNVARISLGWLAIARRSIINKADIVCARIEIHVAEPGRVELVRPRRRRKGRGSSLKTSHGAGVLGFPSREARSSDRCLRIYNNRPKNLRSLRRLANANQDGLLSLPIPGVVGPPCPVRRKTDVSNFGPAQG
jgi:hypothetical protein